MKRLSLVFLLSVLYSFSAFALTSGYYKIKNPGYSRYMYEDFTSNAICTTTSCDDTDYEKIWYISVSGTTVTLKNAYTGHFAQTQSTTSAQFTTGTSSANFTLTTNSDGTYMFSSGSYMHCAASQSYNVVNWWDSSSTYSMWTVESVTVDETALATAQEEYAAVEDINANASTYNTSLLTFFTDASCSELNSTYKGYSDANLKKAMSSLPAALQNAAVSVKNSWSDETNASIASDFRIREYQAYSRAYYWRNKLNATQFTDMNNPTGIYADAKDIICIFVGGEIPSGCSLRVVGLTGNNQASYAAGTELKAGVNAIQSSADLSHLWIMYTYTSDTDVDMSTLDKLKIHIEGGNVYGFSDVTGLDETAANTNYETALTAANNMCTAKSTGTSDLCFVVKGNRGVFYFPLDTYNQIWKTSPYYTSYSTNYNIYKSIHWFDNVLAWEWGIMGFTKRVVDGQTDTHEHVTGGKSIYPTYCNNLALTLQGSGNPYSTTGYTSMPGVSGVESSYNAERADFDNWCVGHESGHNNQGAINLPSCTESSNNLFSNVVCYLHGYRMSRGEPVSTTNSDYQSGTQFALRDIGSTHRMYWQLYLYYHEAQNKTSFYPELFESLRNDPMDLNSNTDDCFLKFYQKACDAAGEDLTEFFRGWGFFVPFENTTFGDYTNHTLTLTQEQIDAAIAAVKAKNYPENTSIMFIEDRIEESYRWDAWASGTTDVRAVQSHAVGTCGDIGSVNDYVSGSTSAEAADYSCYTLTGNTITMDGAGGAGFLVYDASGNLVAFSNSKSFTIPSSAIAAGFTVKVVNADNTSAEVKNVSEAGTDTEKLAALKNALEKANAIINAKDEAETQIGYYKSSAVVTLSTLVTSANAIISSASTGQYGEMINALNQEMANIDINEKAKVEIISLNYYTVQSNAYPTLYMTAGTDNKLTTSASTGADDQKWQFVSTGTPNQYYMMNKSTGKYISTLGTSTQATAVADATGDALTFTVESQDATGVFALKSNASEGYKYLHSSQSQWYWVVGWTATAASMWRISLAEESSLGKATHELAELIDNSETLLNRVVEDYDVEVTETPITLQVTGSTSPFYISTNYQESSEGDIKNLIDDDTSTYFHSTWSANTTDRHYLLVDLGSGNEMDLFTFAMTSRNHNPNNFPSNITVQGSNDGKTFVRIDSLTNNLGTSGLVTYTSDCLGVEGTTYRYLRFVVNKTGSGNGNNSYSHSYYFFALSEFDLNKATRTITPEKFSAYSSVDNSAIVSLYKEMNKAIAVLANADEAEMDTELHVLQGYYDALLALTRGNGDVNLDGKITVADISTLIRILRGYPLSTYGDTDLNNDGSTTIDDVQKLSNMILGK